MKKIVMSAALLLLLGVLTACGETEVESKKVNSVESSEKKKTDEEESNVEDNENEVKDLNQLIVDNENIKATLISVEKITDKTFNEEKIEVKFEVENKRQEAIEVQAREVSADGKMIDESMLSMSQEISAGKRADCVLSIQNYSGDLPQIENDLDMILHVFSWDDMDYDEDHNVKIDF